MQIKTFTNTQLEQACKRQLFTLERKLYSTNLILSEIGDYIPGNVMMQDLDTQTNLYMNKSGCNILGYSREELAELGPEYFKTFFPEEEMTAIFPEIMRVYQAQDPDQVYGFYQRVRKSAAHDYKWYFTCSKLIRNRNGNMHTVLNIASEVNSLGKIVKQSHSVIGENGNIPKQYPRFAMLTKREKEILQHLVIGRNTREIAEMLAISANTVHAHQNNICNKLQINTYAGLVEFATNFGLIN